MSILRIARNVSNLEKLVDFYVALGFHPLAPAQDDPALAALLGAAKARGMRLRLGTRELELTEISPPGAPYPPEAGANSPLFQHIAVLTPDIATAMARALSAGALPISKGGPVHLPPASGNVVAWKFRDPDLHPVEFLQCQDETGYDHSAIVVKDTEKAEAFYGKFGLKTAHRQINQGSEQAMLDGLDNPIVHISTLRAASGPGLELLNYGRGRNHFLTPNPADIAADRLVVTGGETKLFHGPDGHLLLTLEPEGAYSAESGTDSSSRDLPSAATARNAASTPAPSINPPANI
jgi:catechol 2,3-dioxygenase-like lactoylglutathione lyase family enzyme